jgi:hypothetical protein
VTPAGRARPSGAAMYFYLEGNPIPAAAERPTSIMYRTKMLQRWSYKKKGVDVDAVGIMPKR